MTNKIVPMLWYTKDAAEAAKLYASIFPESRVDRVTAMQVDSPSGQPGSLEVVELTLFGQAFTLFGAGPHDPFNDAISLAVQCDSQAEIDRYWDALLESGGKAIACGWIHDRFGVRWQIHPRSLGAWMADTDKVKARRVTEEMMKQVKFDIAKLEAAYRG